MRISPRIYRIVNDEEEDVWTPNSALSVAQMTKQTLTYNAYISDSFDLENNTLYLSLDVAPVDSNATTQGDIIVLNSEYTFLSLPSKEGQRQSIQLHSRLDFKYVRIHERMRINTKIDLWEKNRWYHPETEKQIEDGIIEPPDHSLLSVVRNYEQIKYPMISRVNLGEENKLEIISRVSIADTTAPAISGIEIGDLHVKNSFSTNMNYLAEEKNALYGKRTAKDLTDQIKTLPLVKIPPEVPEYNPKFESELSIADGLIKTSHFIETSIEGADGYLHSGISEGETSRSVYHSPDNSLTVFFRSVTARQINFPVFVRTIESGRRQISKMVFLYLRRPNTPNSASAYMNDRQGRLIWKEKSNGHTENMVWIWRDERAVNGLFNPTISFEGVSQESYGNSVSVLIV
jgi:hypothetical protein